MQAMLFNVKSHKNLNVGRMILKQTIANLVHPLRPCAPEVETTGDPVCVGKYLLQIGSLTRSLITSRSSTSAMILLYTSRLKASAWI